MAQCMEFNVVGDVQGVGFRSLVFRYARSSLITGFVKNLANGSVQIVACGTEKALSGLLDWLRSSPGLAQVRQVTASMVDHPGRFDQFEILY